MRFPGVEGGTRLIRILGTCTVLCLLPWRNTAAAQSLARCEDAFLFPEEVEILRGGEVEEESRRPSWLLAETQRAWRQRKWDRAEQHLDSLIREYPGSFWEIRARALNGLLLKLKGDWDGALVEFERVLAADPPMRLRHDVITSFGCVLLARGQVQRAIELYEGVQRETSDWDQKKFVGYWIKEMKRRLASPRKASLGSCGAGALRYALQQKGVVADDNRILASLRGHEEESLLSMQTLVVALRHFGIDAMGVTAGANELALLPLPFVGLVTPKHYVVVQGVTPDRVTVFDSEKGILSYRPEVFARKWLGYAILLDARHREGVALLGENEMRDLRGGVCGCCPADTPGSEPRNSENTEIPGPTSECNEPGMPRLVMSSTSEEWVIKDTDFAYTPRYGPSIAFKRAYLDDSPQVSAFGKGWTHSYFGKVLEFPEYAQVFDGTGRLENYEHLGGGEFAPAFSTHNVLRRLEDGSGETEGYTLEVPEERVTYRYDPDGLLEWIEDRNGNAVSLEYYDNAQIVGGAGPGLGYFLQPRGVAVDPAGNVYIADSLYRRIQKSDLSGNVLEQWPLQAVPYDVAAGGSERVYVLSYDACSVTAFDPEGQELLQWGICGSGTGRMSYPSGIAVDEHGDVYVADTGNHRVHKFSAQGALLATWGSVGSGNGQFSSPRGIAAGDGAVFVADTGNRRIQKFDYNGGFLLAWGSAGSGAGQFQLPSALEVDGAGRVVVADTSNHRIQVFDADGRFLSSQGRQGTGSDGQFTSPAGITVAPASGQVVVADTLNNRLQILASDVAWTATFGGPGPEPGFYGDPRGTAADQNGDVYVADRNNHRIQKIDPQGNVVLTWGEEGGGAGQFLNPADVAVAPDASVYVADEGNHRIQHFDGDGEHLNSWGSFGSAAGEFNTPSGIDVDTQGAVYVADTGNHRVQKFDAIGGLLGGWGFYGGGNGAFSGPRGIGVIDDKVYVADTGNNRVQRFSPAGAFQLKWGMLGSIAGRFNAPWAVATLSGDVLVADTGNNRVQRFDASGNFLSLWGSAGPDDGQFTAPRGIGAAPLDETVVVADSGADRLQRFQASFTPPVIFGSGGMAGGEFSGPRGVASDPTGNIYVTDPGNFRVQKLDPDGNFLLAWGSKGTGAGEFRNPRAVACDGVGRFVYVVDDTGTQVQKFTEEGTYLTSWSLPAGGKPASVAVDGDGNVLISDWQNEKVFKFDGVGNVLLEWGGAGTQPGLFVDPGGIVTDAAGDILVADTGNNRIQRFGPDGAYRTQWPTAVGLDSLASDADGYVYASTGHFVWKFDGLGNVVVRWGDDVGLFPTGFSFARGLAVQPSGFVVVADSHMNNNAVMRFYRLYPVGKVLVAIVDAAGGRSALSYGENSLVSSVSDPLGHVAYFEYDSDQQLVATTDMEGVPSTFIYDPDGYLQTMTLPSGSYVITRGQEETNQVLTLPDQSTLTINAPYAADLTITDSLDHTISYHRGGWLALGHTDAAGGTTSYTYDALDFRNSVTDPEGRRTSWANDGRGRPLSLEEPGGLTTAWTYDDLAHTATRRSPPDSPYETVYRYDDRENLLSIRDEVGQESIFTYDAKGRVLTVTPPGSPARTTTYTYDDLLRSTTVTDPLGRASVLTYDAMGRLISRQDPMGRLTQYEYNNLGKRIRQVHPGGIAERTWTYDCCGLGTESDEQGRGIANTYDAMHRLTKVTNKPDPQEPALDTDLVTYGYDEAGRRIWMRDPLQRQTIYIPDARNWLADVIYPDGTQESFEYFGDHALKTKTDRAGRTTHFTYDSAGRLSTKTYPDASVQLLTHDTKGRLASASGGETSLSYTYAPATGRMETVTQTLFGVTKTFRYHYLDDGRLEWWRDESTTPQKTTFYAYHDDGALQTITDADEETFTFEYYADGALSRKTYPNGVYTDYAYTDRGFLRSIHHRTDAGQVLAQSVFTDGTTDYYDPVGNRTAMDTLTGQHSYTYDFNNLDRLLTVDRPGAGADESYTYDAAANRLTSTQDADWTYDALNDELDSYDGVAYEYDANGNRRTLSDPSGTTTYSYDFENRLTRVDLLGGAYVEFAYDALGRRVRTRNAEGVVRLYWYNNEDIVLETDEAGVEIARYSHGPGIDNVLKKRIGTSSYCYHEDALGSVVLITNSSGNAVATYSYDAFGNVLSQTGSIENSYLYTGREWDDDSGLYYYRARHYDPKSGRFLQRDPICPRPEEMNPYVYVANNSINEVDPLGLFVRNCSTRSILVKPEDGTIGTLPPGYEWDSAPDGIYLLPDGPWYKVYGKDPLENDIEFTSGNCVVCRGGPCEYLYPIFVPDKSEIDSTWDVPNNPQQMPNIRQANCN